MTFVLRLAYSEKGQLHEELRKSAPGRGINKHTGAEVRKKIASLRNRKEACAIKVRRQI